MKWRKHIFGLSGFAAAVLGAALMENSSRYAARLLWVGFLFPASIVIAAFFTAPDAVARGKLVRPGFVLIALLQWPSSLIVLAAAFFSLAQVTTFSLPLVWFCYTLALFAFVGFNVLLAKQLANPSAKSIYRLFVANIMCLWLLGFVYKGLESLPSFAGLTNLVFPVIFVPLGTLNACWLGVETGSQL
jgi:hypothetical protein